MTTFVGWPFYIGVVLVGWAVMVVLDQYGLESSPVRSSSPPSSFMP